jgi:DNA-directed RNA polymerase subunit M/transcription elongation factor TFIIS
MTLNFCGKCRGILRSQEIDKNKSYYFCDSCNEFQLIKTEEVKNLISNEKMQKQEEKGKGVGENKNIFADYPNICKKCGYDKAQVLDLGIFYSDEDNLILLKCGKCGFSERIGRKAA